MAWLVDLSDLKIKCIREGKDSELGKKVCDCSNMMASIALICICVS